jgi:site-specific DNA-methyltransferase (adenine-specific)
MVEDVLSGKAQWTVVHGDCLDVLPTLPEKSVAHVITDPPYAAGLYARMRTNRAMPETDGMRRGDDERKASREMASLAIGAIDDILEPVAAEIARLAVRWWVVFSDVETSGRWRDAFGPTYVRAGAWVKENPMPQVSGDRPGQGFEMATIGHQPGRKRWNGGGRCAVWRYGADVGAGTERQAIDHPCPKPVPLMLELVELFTDPGEIILDPFAGSGTTGVACLRLGRRFIGIEKDERYAAIARERLTAESRGQSLREFRAGQIPLFGGTNG